MTELAQRYNNLGWEAEHIDASGLFAGYRFEEPIIPIYPGGTLLVRIMHGNGFNADTPPHELIRYSGEWLQTELLANMRHFEDQIFPLGGKEGVVASEFPSPEEHETWLDNRDVFLAQLYGPSPRMQYRQARATLMRELKYSEAETEQRLVRPTENAYTGFVDYAAGSIAVGCIASANTLYVTAAG